MFRRLTHVSDQHYELELVKLEMEQEEPVIVSLSNLKFAKNGKVEVR